MLEIPSEASSCFTGHDDRAMSSSAKADDPVRRGGSASSPKPRRTGYPAFAGYDG